jgi:hypothetical protein
MTRSKRGDAESAEDFAEQKWMNSHGAMGDCAASPIPDHANSALSSANFAPLRFDEIIFDASALINFPLTGDIQTRRKTICFSAEAFHP